MTNSHLKDSLSIYPKISNTERFTKMHQILDNDLNLTCRILAKELGNHR